MKINKYTTLKGNVGLEVDSFKYRKGKDLVSGLISWRCINKDCSAAMKTDLRMSVVKSKSGVHKHLPPAGLGDSSSTLISSPVPESIVCATPSSDVSDISYETSLANLLVTPNTPDALDKENKVLRNSVAELEFTKNALIDRIMEIEAKHMALQNSMEIREISSLDTGKVSVGTSTEEPFLNDMSRSSIPRSTFKSTTTQTEGSSHVRHIEISERNDIDSGWIGDDHMQLYIDNCIRIPSKVLFLNGTLSVQIRLYPFPWEVLVNTDISAAEYIVCIINNSKDGMDGGSHFSLLCYKKSSNQYYHYDSIAGLNADSAKGVAKKIHMCFENRGSPSLLEIKCTQQGNGVDCGVYAVRNLETLCSLIEFNLPVNEYAYFCSNVNVDVTREMILKLRFYDINISSKTNSLCTKPLDNVQAEPSSCSRCKGMEKLLNTFKTLLDDYDNIIRTHATNTSDFEQANVSGEINAKAGNNWPSHTLESEAAVSSNVRGDVNSKREREGEWITKVSSGKGSRSYKCPPREYYNLPLSNKYSPLASYDLTDEMGGTVKNVESKERDKREVSLNDQYVRDPKPQGAQKGLKTTNIQSEGNTHPGKARKRHRKHRVVVISDSQGKDLSHFLRDTKDVSTVVYSKPGATMKTAVQQSLHEISECTRNDLVVVLCGSNDINVHKSYRQSIPEALSLLSVAAQGTNVLVFAIPYRYDREELNGVIYEANVLVYNIVKQVRYGPRLVFRDGNEALTRRCFTRHGMHYNKRGKGLIANYIYLEAETLFSNEPSLDVLHSMSVEKRSPSSEKRLIDMHQYPPLHTGSLTSTKLVENEQENDARRTLTTQEGNGGNDWEEVRMDNLRHLGQDNFLATGPPISQVT